MTSWLKRKAPLKAKAGLKLSGLWRKKLKQNTGSTLKDSQQEQEVSVNPVARKPILKRNGKLKSKSDKRKKQEKVYNELRRQFLTSNPRCRVCGAEATDIHHMRHRGKYYLDTTTFMAVCRLDHQRIHDNVAWAREMGYLIY